MNKKFALLFIVSFFVFAAVAVQAESYKYGPYPNYKGFQVVTTGGIVIPTVQSTTVVDPFGGEYTFGGYGGAEFEVRQPVFIFAASYLEFETSESAPFNPGTDDVILTDVWAIDMEPELDPQLVPMMEGFDPNPMFTEMELIGPGFFEGLSGMIYPSVMDIVPVGDLPIFLDGYDVGPLMAGDPSRIVYVQHAIVPANDFVYRFDYSFDYEGYEYVGGEYPYQHSWILNINQWNPMVAKINDVEIEAPHIIPGYVEVIPPHDWIAGPWYVGRYSYEANPGAEFTNEGSYTGWKVNGKIPYVVPGVVYLTEDGQQASTPVETMVVGQAMDYDFEYIGYVTEGEPGWRGDFNPAYPYQHIWQLNISDWGDNEFVSDIDIEEPWVIRPGYIEVVPPENWHSEGVTVGRYGYEANEGAEISAGGGSIGIDWRVNGKVPQVVPGHVVLTYQQLPISDVKETMIAAPGPACGDWGYLEGDTNNDCQINILDFEKVAQNWLACSDPQGQGCILVGDTAVALGFAFNGNSTNLAQVFFLYEYHNAEVIEPDDIIIEYRGISVASGQELLSVIQSQPALVPGEAVPMRLIRDDEEIEVVAVAEPVKADGVEVIPCDGSHCARVQISGGGPLQDGFVCQCVELVPKYDLCIAIEVRVINPDGKTIKIVSLCVDSGGNSCAEEAAGG